MFSSKDSRLINKDGKFGFTFWVLLLNNDYIRDKETGFVLVYKEKDTADWEAKYFKECRQLNVEVVELKDLSINYIICDY